MLHQEPYIKLMLFFLILFVAFWLMIFICGNHLCLRLVTFRSQPPAEMNARADARVTRPLARAILNINADSVCILQSWAKLWYKSHRLMRKKIKIKTWKKQWKWNIWADMYEVRNDISLTNSTERDVNRCHMMSSCSYHQPLRQRLPHSSLLLPVFPCWSSSFVKAGNVERAYHRDQIWMIDSKMIHIKMTI